MSTITTAATTEGFSIPKDNILLMQPHKSVKDYLHPKRVLVGVVAFIIVVIVVSISVYFGTRDDESGNPTPKGCPNFFSQSVINGTKTSLQSTKNKCRIPHYDIVQDNLDIRSMLSNAKNGDFDAVWPILNDKSYLINVIPEGESYALLHHAAINNDMNALSILVNDTACDVQVKSIPNINDKSIGGKLAQKLTSDENIKNFLQKFTEQKMEERFNTPPIFFATKARGEKYNTHGLPVLLISLSAYKKTFVRNNTVTPSMHFQNILRIVYQVPADDFPSVEKKIINALYGYSAYAAQGLQSSTSKDKFYSGMIRLYTGNSVYEDVNLLMKRQAFYNYTSYKPRGKTLSLGPYALMLDSVLTFWDKLKPYSNLTYRGVARDVSSHHHVDMMFVYLDFVSSTDDINVAKRFAGGYGSVFVMNNKHHSPWQPRDIAAYSNYPHEREYLYPPGAEFIVTNIVAKEKNQYIYLDLKNPEYI